MVPVRVTGIVMTMGRETAAGATGVAMAETRIVMAGQAPENRALSARVRLAERTHGSSSVMPRAKIPPCRATRTMPRPTKWQP